MFVSSTVTSTGSETRHDLRGDIERTREERLEAMENYSNDERFKNRTKVNEIHTRGKIFK